MDQPLFVMEWFSTPVDNPLEIDDHDWPAVNNNNLTGKKQEESSGKLTAIK